MLQIEVGGVGRSCIVLNYNYYEMILSKKQSSKELLMHYLVEKKLSYYVTVTCFFVMTDR